MRASYAISIAEIARKLGGASRVTIYAWLAAGKIPGRRQKEKGAFYVDRQVFEAWLAGMHAAPPLHEARVK